MRARPSSTLVIVATSMFCLFFDLFLFSLTNLQMEREQLNHAHGVGEEAQSASHAFSVFLQDHQITSVSTSQLLFLFFFRDFNNLT